MGSNEQDQPIDWQAECRDALARGDRWEDAAEKAEARVRELEAALVSERTRAVAHCRAGVEELEFMRRGVGAKFSGSQNAYDGAANTLEGVAAAIERGDPAKKR